MLIDSSQKASRPARESGVLLNLADGLDRDAPLVKSDLMYLVEKERLYRRGGSVSTVRRRAMSQRLNAGFGLTLV